MPKTWTWARRRQHIRTIVGAAWFVYTSIALGVVATLCWPLLFSYPIVLPIVLAAFIVPPAWIHIAWVHFPGYLLMSNGIRRLYFSDFVQAQVSAAHNRRNSLDIPALPTEMRTAIELKLCAGRHKRSERPLLTNSSASSISAGFSRKTCARPPG